MKIEVKKYMLSHEGKIYKAGDIVDIADDRLARELVKNSAGSVDFWRGNEYHPTVEDATEDVDGATLPDIDPSESIDNGKKKGKN